EANKEYARQLLTHVNKYTGNAYKDEPAVAMIEINNENSVICMWGGWGGLDKIRGEYLDDFQKQWNRWLSDKYKTDAALQKAWELRSVPLSEELLKNSNFDNGYVPDYKGWAWEIDKKTNAPITNNNGILTARVNEKGEVDWHPQLIGSGFAVKKGEFYTLTVQAKANKRTTLSVGVRMNHEPWEGLGFDSQLELSNDWQAVTFNVLPTASDDNARISIGSFREGITYEIDFVSFKQGGNIGLPEGCSIANANIPVIWKNNASGFTQQAIADFCDFLFDIEAKYWDEMYRFLKDEIKVRQPVSGTQLEYGSALAQAKMDYCDIHSYWNHPSFPNRAWDMNDWFLRNRSLVNYVDRDILTNLATKRIAGKPFTCSEFNAPYPNQYAAEALPMLAAFGAFQNWDGFFPFAYSHSDNPEPRMAASFFDTAGNTVQMAHMIACRALFESNVTADTEITASMDATTERDIFKKDRHQYNIGFTGLGLDKRAALTNRVSLELFGKTKPTTPNIPKIESDKKYFNVENKTFSMCYDLRTEGKGFMYANSDRAGLFTGFVQKQNKYPIYKGIDRQSDWQIEFGETNQNWATATVTNVGKDKTKSNYLVVVTGEMKNTEMQLKVLGDDRVTVGNKWGKPPVLCEGVPAKITIKGNSKNIKVYPLDESGNRKQQLQVASTNNDETVIELKPEYKTIWYEIEM
ncbi:MAG: carbohydrate binding domain-containing protein, partial [Planctomycetaceae bacterium]|nr:carbohydrate binding domain-containing protein [Planctomycetaceae bacterium]